MSILYEECFDGVLFDVDCILVLMVLCEYVFGFEILYIDEEIIFYECDGLSVYCMCLLLVVLFK